MSSGIQGLCIGLSTAVGVQLFYYVFKTSWPTSYSNVTNELEAHHRRGLLRFLMVRALPILVASAASAHVASRLHADRHIAILSFIILHLCITDVGALLRSKRPPASRIAYHLLSALILLLTAGAGLALEPRVPWAFTEPGEFVKALWTAILTTLIGGAYLKATANSSPNSFGIDWVKHDVGEALWDRIPVIAQQEGADVYLIQSIIAAETLQRPRWFRRLERLLPCARTVGIAQTKGAGHTTDEESVVALCRSFSDYYPQRSTTGYISKPHLLECRLENHNSNRAFISDVLNFMSVVQPNIRTGENSFPLAYDNFPTVFVSSARRRGANIQLDGTAACVVGQLNFHDSTSKAISTTVQLDGTRERTSWTVTVPIELNGVHIQHQLPDGTIDAAEIHTDFEYLES